METFPEGNSSEIRDLNRPQEPRILHEGTKVK